jgi:long-chain acyl-CoA synthetase
LTSFRNLPRCGKEYLLYDDGYRFWTYTYRQVAGARRGFAARLAVAGIGKGDKVVIWSENRPEWIVAFWGCVLQGVIVVPVDYQSSGGFLVRVHALVQSRIVLIGDKVAGAEVGCVPV